MFNVFYAIDKVLVQLKTLVFVKFIARPVIRGITVILLLLSSALSVKAEKLTVISDVDDTLKISHVLDTWNMISNSFKLDNHFLGTAELFQELSKENEVQFFYVSNAPRSLIGDRHHQFLEKNEFPTGSVFLRDGLGESDHKIRSMQKIINETQPSTVVLIGDNGQDDTLYYERIAQMYPKIQFITWIRMVYYSKSRGDAGKPLKPGQFGFATSLDLAAEWTKRNWLNTSTFLKFVSDYTPAVLKQNPRADQGEIAFPKWMDCRDVVSSVTDLDPVTANDKNWKDYSAYRRSRCSAASR